MRLVIEGTIVNIVPFIVLFLVRHVLALGGSFQIRPHPSLSRITSHKSWSS
jgi:hypothetical protein